MNAGRPLTCRLEVDAEFDVIEGGHVGSIVGATQLGDHLGDLREAPDLGTELVGQHRSTLERDVLWQGSPNPEVAFFKWRHELTAYREHEQQYCSNEHDGGYTPSQGLSAEDALEGSHIISGEESVQPGSVIVMCTVTRVADSGARDGNLLAREHVTEHGREDEGEDESS